MFLTLQQFRVSTVLTNNQWRPGLELKYRNKLLHVVPLRSTPRFIRVDWFAICHIHRYSYFPQCTPQKCWYILKKYNIHTFCLYLQKPWKDIVQYKHTLYTMYFIYLYVYNIYTQLLIWTLFFPHTYTYIF